MAAKKRPDVSWVNPGAKGSNAEKYKEAVQIARFKKSFVKNNPNNTPVSWRATTGISNKEVNKVYRPMGD